MKIKSRRGLWIFHFNLVEVALALVILAIGLSSVMVLFPVGLKASQGSVADNNLGDVAERVAAYLQARYTSSEVWKDDGEFVPGVISDIISDSDEYSFKSEVEAGSPTSSDFNTDSDSNLAGGMSGLYQLSGKPNYYLYRQYSTVGSGGNDRAIDFEAIVRVGWDNETLTKQYYTKLDGTDPTNGTPGTEKIENYPHPRTADSGVTDPGASRMKSSPDALLQQCCRALIIEISWPADVEWANREKRIFRVEMFNGNFVPYPQTTGSGSGGSGDSGGSPNP